MNNLAVHYKNGEGIEKNLEKAFHWYQKAAENGHTGAMNNLANGYYNGEGTEKNLEKAFHWYQKAAENGQEHAMFNLAACYRNGEGIEKNLEKAFHWYQKAAKNGYTDAVINLVTCYENGEGTEKNLEKAFYWYQKVEENEVRSVCNECKQPYIDYQWCQQCNTKRFRQDFSKWTKWIPYNKLSGINYYDKGGFSEIHKATWLDGPIYSWNFNKQQWNRCNFQTGYEVILKTLNSSSNLDCKFLDEWKYYYNCQKKSFSKFIQFFGFTQDPNNLNYIIIMSLKVIHESNLTHGDFHDGNILIPTIIMLENILSEWNRCISEYYKINRDGNYKYEVLGINNQLKDDMLEFVKADKALMQEQANTSVIQSHSQAYYTSRKLTEILVQEETQGLDCIIED
ncbi:hypothetical protein C1646_817829 [Rhizophagus diaphanus]|nr:hypothetical protein C1646_817829 [Rhizophagus diaphanus] [Rhizophagus sp. MUCL 43196]